jgi:Tfp pilus assembly protein PilF
MSIYEIPGLSGQRRRGSGKYAAAVILLSLLAALVTFIAFIPALGNGFVNWDDPAYVYENTYIRSIDLAFLKWAAKAVVASNWHPLTMLSHAADYSFWGLDAWGHHLTSVALHSLNTSLVMVLTVWLAGLALTSGVQRVSIDEAYRRALYTGLVASLLFGLHPLRVESVAWVAERKDVLSTFFFLLSILAYLRYATSGERRARISYATALLLFLLALLSKPMAISLPFVLLIIDFYPLDRAFWEGRRILIEKLPFFALGAISAGLTLWAQHSGGAIGTLEAHPIGVRLIIAVRAVGFYLYKMVWPTELAPYYPHPVEAALLDTEFAGAVILFIAITLICVLLLRRTRLFAAVWAYYLITLAPVLGIIQVGTQAAADRYTYLPGLAPTMLVAATAALVLKGVGKKRTAAATTAVLVIILFAFCSLTVRQTTVWKDSVTLWTYVIEYYQYTPEADMARILAYYNRGKAHDLKGELTKALEDYDRVIVLSPGNVDAYINRGTAHARAGSLKRALWDFDKAVSLDQKDAHAYLNRGLARLALGRIDPAIEDLKTAAGLRPGLTSAYIALEKAYTIAGNTDKATEARMKATELEAR